MEVICGVTVLAWPLLQVGVVPPIGQQCAFCAAFDQAMVQAPLSMAMHTPSQRSAGGRRLRRRRPEVRPAPGMAASLSTEHRPMLACCPFVCMRCFPNDCHDDLGSAVRCAAKRPVAYLVLARSIAHRRDCLRKPPVRSADRGRLAGEPQRGGASNSVGDPCPWRCLFRDFTHQWHIGPA
jgi:hypothetical protein